MVWKILQYYYDMIHQLYNATILFATSFLLFYNALAENNLKMPLSCAITPEISLLEEIPEINKSNNLRRIIGASEFAEGLPIIITGFVMDSNCVPISDVVVEIWHNNSKGGSYTALQDDSLKKDEYFANSGSTITDNMGRYHFLTILPGSAHPNDAPKVYFRLKSKEIGQFETLMLFDNQFLNDNDSLLKKQNLKTTKAILIAKSDTITPEQIGLDSKIENVIYEFNITLPIKNKFKSY